jgi:hypothetical protein
VCREGRLEGWFDENTLIDSSINCIVMKLVWAGIWMVLYFELGFVERERAYDAMLGGGLSGDLNGRSRVLVVVG